MSSSAIRSEREYTWYKVGWREFWRPFGHDCLRFGQSCPGGRDLFWLTLFFWLATQLLLLLFGTRTGLLYRFADTLLGRVDGYGVPLVMKPDVMNNGAINRAVLQDMGAVAKSIPGLQVFPYDEETLTESFSYGAWPGPGVWRRAEAVDGQGGVQSVREQSLPPTFYVRMVQTDDPYWVVNGGGRGSRGLPLTLVANRALFEEWFDFKAYRKALAGDLPAAWIEHDAPEILTKVDDLKALWLRVRVGDWRELVRFPLRWASRMPVARKTVFLYPLASYRALKAAYNWPHDLHY
jgi:hypothetical protein